MWAQKINADVSNAITTTTATKIQQFPITFKYPINSKTFLIVAYF